MSEAVAAEVAKALIVINRIRTYRLFPYGAFSGVTVGKNKKTKHNKKHTNAQTEIGFIFIQLLNKLSLKVPVAQVLKTIERSLKPEQLGLSSSICLKVVCKWNLLAFMRL